MLCFPSNRNRVKVDDGELGHDVHGLDTEGDDAEKEVEDLAGLVVLGGPVVGVVGDAAVFVGGDLDYLGAS